MADQTTDFLNFLNDQLNTRVASNEAIFQPTSDGFFTITDGLGKLTISIDGITNYADGTELKLEIVNLTSVTLISVHLDVSLSQANSIEKYWSEPKKTSEVSVHSIPPGTAVIQTVRFSQWTPKDIKYIHVGYRGTGGISYKKAN